MIDYMSDKQCSYIGCDRPHRAKGYCVAHYYQLRRTGGTFDIIPRGTPKTVGCKVEDCGETHFARGWCQRHHRQLWTRYAKYGITVEQFDELMAKQGGLCAICQVKPEVFAVDHNHRCCPGQTSCGRCVRGLLCLNCNSGLGMFRDDRSLLRAAENYLLLET